MKIVTNLVFGGRCREAFEFYASVLQGTIRMMIPFGDVPGEEKLGPHMQDKIMHAWLEVGDQALMACDSPSGEQSPASGFSVSVHVANVEEARRIYDALGADGILSMPFAPTDWSAGFGMLVDRFGIPWTINTAQEQH